MTVSQEIKSLVAEKDCEIASEDTRSKTQQLTDDHQIELFAKILVDIILKNMAKNESVKSE
ncbi:hypothetical protein [Phnomibacter ginsenosidimutans]|uniref:Uncharacterized protein n=1 Tax=Phnomibacter ginsenosidimutans TaxID=2676868 RepID=A0A6I6GKV5_9BACT|nr:hypothetical protein [Phnomibacter ginsenosidimutans]QGW27532.1 hypothetical protein GLV81_04940 [Phnomibacter ginsenosidimutans]